VCRAYELHSRITIRDLIDKRRRSIRAPVVDDDQFGVDSKTIDFRRDLGDRAADPCLFIERGNDH
jgi:hypothetical protein